MESGLASGLASRLRSAFPTPVETFLYIQGARRNPPQRQESSAKAREVVEHGRMVATARMGRNRARRLKEAVKASGTNKHRCLVPCRSSRFASCAFSRVLTRRRASSPLLSLPPFLVSISVSRRGGEVACTREKPRHSELVDWKIVYWSILDSGTLLRLLRRSIYATTRSFISGSLGAGRSRLKHKTRFLH